MNKVEQVEFDGVVFAIIVRNGSYEPGIHFYTQDDFSQQLATIRHSAGHLIEPHIHQVVQRTVHLTNEVLVLRRGRLRVDFYAQDQSYLDSRELGAGDVILLAAGGHGFEILEDVEMIEIKQGPYSPAGDKKRFPGRTSAKATADIAGK